MLVYICTRNAETGLQKGSKHVVIQKKTARGLSAVIIYCISQSSKNCKKNN